MERRPTKQLASSLVVETEQPDCLLCLQLLRGNAAWLIDLFVSLCGGGVLLYQIPKWLLF
jgi:hypothetical protein